MAVRPLRDEPNIWTHQGFLLAEDEMMKDHLSGITVPGKDVDAPKVPLGVWFRWPEGERQIRYPFATIDLLQAEPAFDLFSSDYYLPEEDLYRPSVSPDIPVPPEGWDTQGYAIRNYLPFRLMYQVAVHARNALHDRYLHSIFRSDVFPPRPFWIWCATDETWRRTEVSSMVAADASETTESGTKRIFRKVYTISTLAEVPQDRILDSVIYRALRVLIPVVWLPYMDSYRDQFLTGHPDPLSEFTQQEREDGGEVGHVWHQGLTMPTASSG